MEGVSPSLERSDGESRLAILREAVRRALGDIDIRHSVPRVTFTPERDQSTPDTFSVEVSFEGAGSAGFGVEAGDLVKGDLLARVADCLQDYVADDSYSESYQPTCALHDHPASANCVDGRAVWCCRRGCEMWSAPVGELGTSPELVREPKRGSSSSIAFRVCWELHNCDERVLRHGANADVVRLLERDAVPLRDGRYAARTDPNLADMLGVVADGLDATIEYYFGIASLVSSDGVIFAVGLEDRGILLRAPEGAVTGDATSAQRGVDVPPGWSVIDTCLLEDKATTQDHLLGAALIAMDMPDPK